MPPGYARSGVMTGSPPRAWGQCKHTAARSRYGCLVHPHGRGDNTLRCSARRCCSRFTPTGVGTMQESEPRFEQRIGSPPRAWGQWNAGRLSMSFPVGSPPRAWGQWVRQPRRLAHPRFTPTGVGTIFRTGLHRSAFPVHPHGRGDNSFSTRASGRSLGSPPRAWGQCTFAVEISTDGSTVHPHGRGDNCSGDHPAAAALRFTPTGVGTMQYNSAVVPVQRRFTPTGVGTIGCREI